MWWGAVEPDEADPDVYGVDDHVLPALRAEAPIPGDDAAIDVAADVKEGAVQVAESTADRDSEGPRHRRLPTAMPGVLGARQHPSSMGS